MPGGNPLGPELQEGPLMGGNTIELTAANFAETIEKNETVIIDFWASWCGPCMRFAPVFEEASTRHDDITFAKLDTEAERDVAAGMEITSIPTLMVVRDGILVYRQPGALPEPQLELLIDKARDLDMDVVRRQPAGDTSI